MGFRVFRAFRGPIRATRSVVPPLGGTQAEGSSESNASAGRSASDVTNRSASSRPFFLTPMLGMPARRAPSTPAAASSTTMQRAGGTPSRSAALRKICGSGLPDRHVLGRRRPRRAGRRDRATWSIMVDVRAGRRRGDRLLPAGRPERVEPFPGAGQRRQPVRLGEPAILRFLGLADPRHARDVHVRAEPDRNDAIVSLPEAREELRRRSARPLRAHRVAPRQPVKFFGIDQRAVEIPEDRPAHFFCP